MSTHTPGPWRVGKNSDGIVADVPVQNGASGTDDVEYYGGYLIAETVAPRNRPLIAAAPDLLQALQEVVGAHAEAANCFYCEADTGTPHDPDCTMHFVIAAIAKAEGRS